MVPRTDIGSIWNRLGGAFRSRGVFWSLGGQSRLAASDFVMNSLTSHSG